MGLLTQDTGRTVDRYWPIEGPTNGIQLRRAWDDAKQAISSQEARNRQRQCLFRNVIVTCEALIIDLLLAAGLIKSDKLDVKWILEIRHWGIVESDMTVHADPEADDIDRRIGKVRRISLRRRRRVWFGNNAMHSREGEMIEEGGIEPMGETLRCISRKTDVLIHMKGRYSVPVNSPLLPKATKGFCLARCGSKNHSHLRLAA